MGSSVWGFMLGCCLLLAIAWGPVQSLVPRFQEEQLELGETEEVPPPQDHMKGDKGTQETYSPSQCYRCCDPNTPVYQAIPPPQINITILKGDKGDRGDRGLQGKVGKAGATGPRGHIGPKGQKGSIGSPGDPCKNHYAAFSVGRKKDLHSNDYFQPVLFDTEFVNLYKHFNMFTGKFYCYVPGIYFFSLNVHTWNQKETYLHIMKNEEEMVILYAQTQAAQPPRFQQPEAHTRLSPSRRPGERNGEPARSSTHVASCAGPNHFSFFWTSENYGGAEREGTRKS